jgi:hypothetical protein
MKILIPAIQPTVSCNITFGVHPILMIVVHLDEPSHYRNNKDIWRRVKDRNKHQMIGRGMAMRLAQTLPLLTEILFSSVHSLPRARDCLPTKLHKCFHDHKHQWANADYQMLISISLLSMTTRLDEVYPEDYHKMLVNIILSKLNKPH